MDSRVLMVACLVTVLATVVFGLVPAIGSARSEQSGLRQRTGHALTDGRRTVAGNTFVMAEVAFTVALLAAAGLLGRSFWELTRVRPGFQPDHVLTMRTTLPGRTYPADEHVRAFHRDLLQRIQRLPGVIAVGSADYLPMGNFGIGDVFDIEGRPVTRPEDRRGSWVSVVAGRFFDAMGIPLIRGHLPTDADTERTRPVFVIDEELAHRYWPNEDPVGTHLTWRLQTGRVLSGEIIGVVGSVRWQALSSPPPGTTYWWFPQEPNRELMIAVRTAGDPVAMAPIIEHQVTDIDPNQPVTDIRPMQEFISADLAPSRWTIGVLGGFAITALLLASIGLYGVISTWAARRTQEIGVRVALGAQYRDVLGLVMRRGMLLVGAGLMIGIAATLVVGPVVAGLLYGISPRDPASLLVAALCLTLVTMLAIYLPARRAALADPILALRAE
jgi:putative ABC transport system permease protein